MSGSTERGVGVVARGARRIDVMGDVVRDASVPMALLDRELRYLAASDRWTQLYGAGRSDLTGLLHYDVVPSAPERWRQAHRQGLAGEHVRQRDDSFVFDGGERHWFDWSVAPWRDEAGAVAGIVITVDDVTERKRAEVALRESEGRYHALVDESPDGIFVHVDQRVAYVNAAAAQIFGARDASELVGRPLYDFVAPSDHAVTEARQDAHARHERVLPVVITTRPISGPAREVEVSSIPTIFDGHPAVYGVLRDVTERRRLAREREETEARFTALAENIPEAFSFTDAERRRILYVSPTFGRVYGLSCAEVLEDPRRWLALVHPEDREAIVAGMARRDAHEITFRIVHPQAGDVRWIRLRTWPIHDASGAVLSVGTLSEDVTERKRGEERLRESEERYRALVERSPDSIFVHVERRLVYANAAAERLFGASAAELVGRPISDVIDPRHHADVARREAAFERGEEIPRFVVTTRPLTGEPREVEVTAIRTTFDGQPAIQVLGHDVTEERRLARQGAESEARFTELAENVDEVFSLTSGDRRRVIYLSPAFERVFGVRREDVLASPEAWARIIHPDDWPSVVARSGTAEAYEHEYRIVRPDGALRRIRARVRPMRDAAGAVTKVIAVSEDVTERRALEAQLLQSQKLESIGSLAGGLAHDFNNLLTVVTSAAELLRDEPLSDEARSFLGEIDDAGRRGASLTRQLLSFSRQDILEPTVVELGALVEEALRLLRRLIGENVQLTHTRRDAVRVRVDAGQWDQVLVNLVVNARDAMPKGGTLRVETGSIVIATGDARFPDAPPGAYALLRVADSGAGMSPDVRARIFEPFFTTKPRQQGTGLGLAVVYGIVKQAGGHIHVDSEPGRGTMFSILVPLSGKPADAPSTASARQRALLGGSETILLVEDDDAVRRVASRSLTQRGYEVLTAQDGEAALAVLEHRRVDLVLTDVVMPKLDGPSLVRAILARWPRVRVLLSTGYIDGSLDMRELADHPVLRKPYSQQKLLEKVREVLRG